MIKRLSPQELGELFHAIENKPTGKLSELAKIAGLSLAEDYIGVDLSGEDLSKDDLRGANFKDGNLSNTNLSNTNLSYSNLTGANLNNANLKKANLIGANLNNATVKNAVFEDNLGISKALKQYLKKQGAIFPDDYKDGDLLGEAALILRQLMRLPEIIIQNKLSKSRIAKLLEYLENFAHQQVLKERLNSLSEISKKRFTPTEQMLFKILPLILGFFIYSNIFRIYTDNYSFGNLAWPMAILGGLVASVGVNYLATEACSQYVHRQVTRKALNKLERQKDQELTKGENNLFHRQFWDTKIKLVYDIEGGILASSHEIKIAGRKISIYIIGALILNVIEFTGAFYLVSKLGLFDDLPAYIKLVISSLPVVMTWMLAYVQAEWFNRCEYVRELLRKYKKKAIEMSFDYIDDIALVRLKADNKAMLNHSAEYYTVESVELAELDAVIKYFQYKFQERKKYYQLERQVLNNEYEEEKRKFEAEYPEFEENVEEHAPEQINRLRQAYEAEKSQTLANKFKEIDDQKKEAENDCYRRLREDWQQLEIELNTAIRDFEKKTLKQREQPLRSFQLA